MRKQAYIYTTCLMAQGAKQLYFLYNPIMKVLVMGFSFAHILIQGANYIALKEQKDVGANYICS
ncbi:hypothetical protein ACN9NO_04725 [Glaesserella parasuis]|uniref:Uncharacterized protein n=1 Tax=Glaesserella parasuis serovar 5 (strain SH0165) TaxID=557723 RepID=B8F5K9_GLAP5|nr:hypothetical protein HAPS_0991 [Glaesserella parasuis SH0165]